MKFLTSISRPSLTITRTRRKCIINEVAELVTLYESTIKIEINVPSIWQGIRDKVESVATKYLVNIFSDNLARGAVWT